MPRNLSFEGCSSVFLAGITSWQALVEHGKLEAGKKVFINGGSSGTGTWAIQVSLDGFIDYACTDYPRYARQWERMSRLLAPSLQKEC